MSRLLCRPEVSTLTSALPGPRAGKPGAAPVRSMAVATLPALVPHAVAAAELLIAGVVAATTTGLTHGELGQRSRILLTLWTRQRCANQRPMDGTFLHVHDAREISLRFVAFHVSILTTRFSTRSSSGSSTSFSTGVCISDVGNKRVRYSDRLVVRLVESRSGFNGGSSQRRVCVRLSSKHLFVQRCRRFLLLPARCLAALVWMFGVAGRTTRLLDVFFDHGYHRVIRHSTLTRTVVVQYVSETQPALLH